MSSLGIVLLLFLGWSLIATVVCVSASRQSALLRQSRWEEGDEG